MDLLSNVVSGKEIREIDLRFLRQQIGKNIKLIRGRRMIQGWIHDVERVSEKKIVLWISGKQPVYFFERGFLITGIFSTPAHIKADHKQGNPTQQTWNDGSREKGGNREPDNGGIQDHNDAGRYNRTDD